jgi:hypothetical protein
VRIASQAQIATYQVNPGYVTMFPWLSGIARSFQQYQIIGMAFEYVPTSGFAVGSDSAALGQVVIAPRYNVTEGVANWPASSLQGMLNMDGSVSGSPAAPSSCYIECKPSVTKSPTKYIWTAQQIVNPYSQADFDHCGVVVYTSGSQNEVTVQCGQLWVTYQIKLLQPRTVNPNTPIVLTPDLRDILQEYNTLHQWTGVLTVRERYRLGARVRELGAYIASYPFQKSIADEQLAYELLMLDQSESKDPADLDPWIEKLIDERAPHYAPPRSLPLAMPRGETQELIQGVNPPFHIVGRP